MATKRRHALVVDDDPNMRDLVVAILEEGDFECQATDTATEAYQMVGQEKFDLLIIDRKLPDTDGTRLLQQIRGLGVATPAIIITGHPSIETAAEALQWEAYDYLVKPFDVRELLEKAQRAISDQGLVDENLYLWETLEKKYNWRHVLSRNARVQQTYVMAAKAASYNAPVLIQGETGTGKEYLARAVHYLGERAEQPMVTLNCGGFPDELLENELFGHEKGAFTSANTAKVGLCEIADGGTLFLDEITHMSAAMQVKILRFVEDHSFMRLGGTKPITVDVRIIAASNQPVNELVESDQFREDLYYRLNVISLTLPPLRRRPEDIEVFVKHFMKQFGAEASKQVSKEAWEELHSHNWPGNLRELRNAIQRAIVLSVGDSIKLEDLLLEMKLTTRNATDSGPDDEKSSSLLTLEELERRHILAMLEACDGDREAAAEILGVSRAILGRRLKKYEETD